MTRAFLFLMAALCSFAQNDSIIQGRWPPETALSFRDGSNNQEYICTALTRQPNYRWTGSSMITSIADAANTSTITFVSAHGLLVGNKITISGMASAGTTGLNTSFNVATVGSTTTLTITTSGITDGTYTPGTDPLMAIDATAPRTTASIWQIIKKFYTTTYLDRTAWADGDSQPTKVCDSRTTYSYQ